MADICLMVEGQEDLTWERWFQMADAAEALGFGGLFRSDHLIALSGVSGRQALALWPSLTALAERTSRIRFGPLVCSITFRHPAMIAKMAASVDQLANGRLDLGLGAGWHAREHQMFGINYPPFRERVDRLDEGAAVIRALWSGERINRESPYYPLIEAEIHPIPAHQTLIMGGKGERTLTVVARHATEWNCSYASLEVFIDKSAALDEACHVLGRDPAGIVRSFMIPFAIGDSDRMVQSHIEAHRDVFPDLPPDADGWKRAGFLVGSPAEIVDQISQRIEAGATRFMLQQNALDDVDSVERFASDVLPHVR